MRLVMPRRARPAVAGAAGVGLTEARFLRARLAGARPSTVRLSGTRPTKARLPVARPTEAWLPVAGVTTVMFTVGTGSGTA
jgi:hypothetical protein